MAITAALVLGAAWAFGRGGNDPTSFGGGGDTVGSLPLMSGPPNGGDPNQPQQPLAPIFTLVGTPAEIADCIVDAYPTGPNGAYYLVELDGGRVRMEFHGRMTVIVDRARFQASAVRGEILVGTNFLGAQAEIKVGGVLRAVQTLMPGPLDLRLRALDSAGVLTQGLFWHAVNLENTHRVLALRAVGNQIRIEQRD